MTFSPGFLSPQVRERIEAEYRSRRPHSRDMFARSQRSFPGGETRSVTHYEPFPTVIDHGAGSHLFDVDGIEYIDLVNNYTSLIHGNAYPPIAEAISAAAVTGTVFPSMHLSQLRLAEEIIARVPAVDMVRLTNSGSEAAALALRIARRATGRRVLVTVSGGYHGAVPPFTEGEPETRTLPFGDSAALSDMLDDHVAAVFMEPFLGAGGVIPQDPGYLRAAQEAAHRVGALFVVDEVQSLRNSPHGEAARLSLDPDLVLMAKIIGGGLPIGAVGGRRELLELTAATRPEHLEHAGTFNGHVATAAAGLVSLQHLTTAAISELNAHAQHLAEHIEAAGADRGFPLVVTRSGSILNVHPGDAPVTSPADAHRFPPERAALHLALLLEGIYTTPRGMINLSTALSEDDLSAVYRGYDRACERLAS